MIMGDMEQGLVDRQIDKEQCLSGTQVVGSMGGKWFSTSTSRQPVVRPVNDDSPFDRELPLYSSKRVSPFPSYKQAPGGTVTVGVGSPGVEARDGGDDVGGGDTAGRRISERSTWWATTEQGNPLNGQVQYVVGSGDDDPISPRTPLPTVVRHSVI